MFCLVAENEYGPRGSHAELLLQKNIFCCCNTAANQNDFILLSCCSKNPFETTWDYWEFFIALIAQRIAFQGPEKCCKWFLILSRFFLNFSNLLL